MSRRQISQAEARRDRKLLRALQRWIAWPWNAKIDSVAQRYIHLGALPLNGFDHGFVMGMREMVRDTDHAVVFVGEMRSVNGQPQVNVYAVAMPHHGAAQVEGGDDA